MSLSLPTAGASSPLAYGSQIYGTRVALANLIGQFVKNPDELWQIDQNGYELIYQNATVKSELKKLIGPIKSAPITITGYGEPYDAILTEAFRHMVRLPRAIEQLLDAFVKGVRLVENIWGEADVEYEDMRLRMNLVMDFAIHDERRFARDESGEWWQTQDGRYPNHGMNNYIVNMSTGNAKWVDPDKVIIHSFADGDGRYGYGYGIGAKLYPYVMGIRALYSYAMDYGQIFSNPWIERVLTEAYIKARRSDSNLSVSDIMDDELEKLNNTIGGDKSITMEGNELKMIEPASMGDAASFYENMIGILSDDIRHMITGESITGKSDKMGGGSLAKSQVAESIPMERRFDLTQELQITLTEQLLWPIVKYNRGTFSGIERIRSGRVVIHTPTVNREFAIETMMKMNAPVLKKEYYEKTGFTQPSADQVAEGETLIPAAKDPMQANGFDAFGDYAPNREPAGAAA